MPSWWRATRVGWTTADIGGAPNPAIVTYQNAAVGKGQKNTCCHFDGALRDVRFYTRAIAPFLEQRRKKLLPKMTKELNQARANEENLKRQITVIKQHVLKARTVRENNLKIKASHILLCSMAQSNLNNPH